MAATASPPFDRAALARFLAAGSGAARVEVTPPALLPGGAIRENWGFDATFDGGALPGRQRLVLRTDPPTGIAASLDRLEEFAVVKAAAAAGVTVPEPLWACADRDTIGKPFYIMRHLPGTAQGRQITTDPEFEPVLPALAERLGVELARIQTIRPPRPELGFLPTVGAAEHIAQFRAYLDRHPNPRPVLEWAIRWLERHRPEPLPPVLCHRDFRTGNYMLATGQLTGILDWEFAGWGDPDEDIGWFCCKGWRFARLDREAGGIADRAPFYAGYEHTSGRRLDPRRVHFWEVLANVRWAVIALQQSDRYLVDGARDLSTAIIGRRASECDLELLMLLDPDGAGPITPSPPPGERVGVRGQGSDRLQDPSPGSPHLPRATLSRIAGEGQTFRDLPSGIELLALGREMLVDDLLRLLPAERHRDLRLVATAMAIAEREAAAGEGPVFEIAAMLAALYGEPATSRPAACPLPNPPPPAGQGRVGVSPPASSAERLLARLAADLRAGAFDTCEARARQARAVLWRTTLLKLREGNPQFLAANGFGE